MRERSIFELTQAKLRGTPVNDKKPEEIKVAQGEAKKELVLGQ